MITDFLWLEMEDVELDVKRETWICGDQQKGAICYIVTETMVLLHDISKAVLSHVE